jgi:hypothetical protein
VVPFTKWVFCPVIVTVSDWPWSPELATTERMVGTAEDDVTVSVVLPTTVPLVAVMVVDPAVVPAVANPAALMVAVAVVPEAHVTLVVRFWVELSV